MSFPSLLIAEDDEALAALLEEYLSEADYDVVLCHRGDTALERIKEKHFDLILSDVVMPGADGLTLLAEASGNPAETLVILMTGYSGIDDAIHAVEQGAYDFVSKPFQLPEIRVRLDNAAKYQSMLRRWNAMKGSVVLDLAADNYLPMQPAQHTGQAAFRAYGIVKE